MNYEIARAIREHPEHITSDYGPILALAMRVEGQYMDAMYSINHGREW